MVPLLRDGERSHRLLKPTQIASYHPRIAYPTTPKLSRFPGYVRNRWTSLLSLLKYSAGEHLFSNLALAAYLVKPLPANTVSATINRINIPATVRAVFDWCLALAGLTVAAPLFLLVALAIKLDSSGPVFYRQERVGINRRKVGQRRSGQTLHSCRRMVDRRGEDKFGKPFMVYKFRTMVVDAEKKCGPIWATKNDPRITKLGRILRRTRLDEMPQLFNVLKGEMSMVGPRPERPFFIEKLSGKINGYTRRLDVKPGITGLAQVESGYDSSLDDVCVKVNYDLKYIDTASVRKDLAILVRTIGVVLGCRGV